MGDAAQGWHKTIHCSRGRPAGKDDSVRACVVKGVFVDSNCNAARDGTVSLFHSLMPRPQVMISGTRALRQQTVPGDLSMQCVNFPPLSGHTRS